MGIKTKYNIGDEMWFMFDGKPLNGKIVRISDFTIKVKVIFEDGKEYFSAGILKALNFSPPKKNY